MDVGICTDGYLDWLSLCGTLHSIQNGSRYKRAMDSLLYLQTPPLCCHWSLYRTFHLSVGCVSGYKGFSIIVLEALQRMCMSYEGIIYRSLRQNTEWITSEYKFAHVLLFILFYCYSLKLFSALKCSKLLIM